MRTGPIGMGIATGLAAALAQSALGYQPPSAYGICVVCHGRDLVNAGAGALLGLELNRSGISQLFPALTTVGILAAALIAAIRHREFRPRSSGPALRAAALGFFVMLFGLAAAACPVRLFLRTAYGDLVALAGVAALIAGIYLSNLWLCGGVGE